MQALKEALKDWSACIGSEFVGRGGELKPGTAAEVAECLKIASRHRVPVYPLSRGRNLGNGARTPPQDAVIMDLSRMDRILDYDERLGFVRIEPGVTQASLASFLKAKNAKYALAMTGGPSDSSLIGNMLERGDAYGAYAERAEAACNPEFVLASGEIVQPYEQCGMLADSAPRLAGPDFTPLLFQSNWGVVTKMTLWLEPKALHVDHLVLSIDEAAELSNLMDQLRDLKMKGCIDGFFVWNDVKALSRLTQYPFERTNNQTPLPDAIRAELRARFDVGRFNISVFVRSFSPEQRAANLGFLKGLADNFSKFVFFDAEEVEWGEDNMRMVYWRKRFLPNAPFDVERDQCGLLWCMPLVPFLGADLVQAATIAEEVTKAFGFECNWGATPYGDRALRVFVALCYDRAIEGEHERAQQCHDKLLSSFMKAGYWPYRLGVQSMWAMQGYKDGHRNLQTRIKQALDPLGIIAPGRYESSDRL